MEATEIPSDLSNIIKLYVRPLMSTEMVIMISKEFKKKYLDYSGVIYQINIHKCEYCGRNWCLACETQSYNRLPPYFEYWYCSCRHTPQRGYIGPYEHHRLHPSAVAFIYNWTTTRNKNFDFKLPKVEYIPPREDELCDICRCSVIYRFDICKKHYFRFKRKYIGVRDNHIADISYFVAISKKMFKSGLRRIRLRVQ